MLIPFGVFSAAGAGGGAAAGAYELIATAFGTGSSNTISFSSIASSYKHLQIRYLARTTGTGTSGDTMSLRFNGDSGANYARHYLQGDGSSVTSAAGTDGTSINYFSIIGQTGTTNVFGQGIIDILDYTSTAKNTTVRALTGNLHSNNLRLVSGVWIDTSAVNSISLITGGNHITTARYSLYGIKG